MRNGNESWKNIDISKSTPWSKKHLRNAKTENFFSKLRICYTVEPKAILLIWLSLELLYEIHNCSSEFSGIKQGINFESVTFNFNQSKKKVYASTDMKHCANFLSLPTHTLVHSFPSFFHSLGFKSTMEEGACEKEKSSSVPFLALLLILYSTSLYIYHFYVYDFYAVCHIYKFRRWILFNFTLIFFIYIHWYGALILVSPFVFVIRGLRSRSRLSLSYLICSTNTLNCLANVLSEKSRRRLYKIA